MLLDIRNNVTLGCSSGSPRNRDSKVYHDQTGSNHDHFLLLEKLFMNLPVAAG